MSKYLSEMEENTFRQHTEEAVDDMLMEGLPQYAALKSHEDMFFAKYIVHNFGKTSISKIYINGQECATHTVDFEGFDFYFLKEVDTLYLRIRNYILPFEDATEELIVEIQGYPLSDKQKQTFGRLTELKKLRDDQIHFCGKTNLNHLFFNGRFLCKRHIDDARECPSLGIGLYCMLNNKEIYFENLMDGKTYHLIVDNHRKNEEIFTALSYSDQDKMTDREVMGMRVINEKLLYHPEKKKIYIDSILPNLYLHEETHSMTMTRDSWIGVMYEEEYLYFDFETEECTKYDKCADLEIIQVDFEEIDQPIVDFISQNLDRIE